MSIRGRSEIASDPSSHGRHFSNLPIGLYFYYINISKLHFLDLSSINFI